MTTATTLTQSFLTSLEGNPPPIKQALSIPPQALTFGNYWSALSLYVFNLF